MSHTNNMHCNATIILHTHQHIPNLVAFPTEKIPWDPPPPLPQSPHIHFPPAARATIGNALHRRRETGGGLLGGAEWSVAPCLVPAHHIHTSTNLRVLWNALHRNRHRCTNAHVSCHWDVTNIQRHESTNSGMSWNALHRHSHRSTNPHESYICDITNTSVKYVTWLIHKWHKPYICDMTHTYMTWLIHMWHYSYVCDITLTYVTWLIHTLHDSFTYSFRHVALAAGIYMYILMYIYIQIYMNKYINIYMHIYTRKKIFISAIMTYL